MARPWTRQDIETLITFLQRDVNEFGFTITNGGKEQIGNIGLSLHFAPTDEGNLKPRTKALLDYLKKVWGPGTPLKQEYNPFEEARPLYALDENVPVAPPHVLRAAARDIQWGDALGGAPLEAPKAKRFASKDDGIHRFKYAYVRPDGGQITVFIY